MKHETTRGQAGRHESTLGRYRPRHNPPGTKLVKRFIKSAKGEAVEYRKDLLAMAGEQLP